MRAPLPHVVYWPVRSSEASQLREALSGLIARIEGDRVDVPCNRTEDYADGWTAGMTDAAKLVRAALAAVVSGSTPEGDSNR